MDMLILLTRICIWSMFVMTVLGVPYLVIRLNRFIAHYYKAHRLLQLEVATLRRDYTTLLQEGAHGRQQSTSVIYEAQHDGS